MIAVHRAEPPAQPVRPIGEIEPFFRERQEIAKRWPFRGGYAADSSEFSGSAAASQILCNLGNSCTQIGDRLEHIANREQIVYTPLLIVTGQRGRPHLPCPPNPGHKEREK
jgi:hypothetical protein